MGDGCCHGGGVDGLERGEEKNGRQMREIESLSLPPDVTQRRKFERPTLNTKI